MKKVNKMKTINELMKVVNVNSKSVRCGDSRTILKKLDEPAIAYGIGYGGFVCIIKIRSNTIKGYGFSGKHIGTGYPEGGFYILSAEEVLEEIKTNKFLVDKYIDKNINNYCTDTIQRPVLGEFTIEKHMHWMDKGQTRKSEHRLVRLKSGKIRAEYKGYWNGRYSRESISSTLITFKNALNNDENITHNTLSEELIKEAEDQIIISEI